MAAWARLTRRGSASTSRWSIWKEHGRAAGAWLGVCGVWVLRGGGSGGAGSAGYGVQVESGPPVIGGSVQARVLGPQCSGSESWPPCSTVTPRCWGPAGGSHLGRSSCFCPARSPCSFILTEQDRVRGRVLVIQSRGEEVDDSDPVPESLWPGRGPAAPTPDGRPDSSVKSDNVHLWVLSEQLTLPSVEPCYVVI